MAARSRTPLPPRTGVPDLPAVLDEVSAVHARDDLLGVALVGLGGDVDAAHARIGESRLAGATVGHLDLTGTTLVDVAVDDLRAVEVIARDGTWRNVEISGGRIATLDGLRARWDSVVLRGVHVDYLSLPSAEVTDVLFVDCRFGTIDLPEGRLTRVAFQGCRADEVDTRGLRAADLDLRGLEALSFTDARSLTGAWLEPRQAELHAATFAQALGIRIAT